MSKLMVLQSFISWAVVQESAQEGKIVAAHHVFFLLQVYVLVWQIPYFILLLPDQTINL
jgi:hypothetical protein